MVKASKSLIIIINLQHVRRLICCLYVDHSGSTVLSLRVYLLPYPVVLHLNVLGAIVIMGSRTRSSAL